MKTFFRHLPLLFLLALPAAADPAARAVELEARLKETAETSPAGAELMLGLIDHYWQDGQVFGLIRTAGKFARSQPDHPRRAEVMLKLIDGHAAAARHDDVIVTGRQFLGDNRLHARLRVPYRSCTCFGNPSATSTRLKCNFAGTDPKHANPSS